MKSCTGNWISLNHCFSSTISLQISHLYFLFTNLIQVINVHQFTHLVHNRWNLDTSNYLLQNLLIPIFMAEFHVCLNSGIYIMQNTMVRGGEWPAGENNEIRS